MTESAAYPPLPILLVDDEEQTLRSCKVALRASGLMNVETVQDSRQVPALLASQTFSAILLDILMPHMTGEQLLATIHEDYSQTPVIMLTGNNDLETAVRCMQKGAFDYLVKPVDKNRLVSAIKRAIQFRDLSQENLLLKQHILSDELMHPEAFSEMQTVSGQFRAIFKYVESISQTTQPVLITGETGVGKDLMARATHRASGRQGSFVPVNVAGLDDVVFSDTLFGHRRGAFTGAAENRKGLVETASGGTLFLDEIGDLMPGSQVKLLRLLQDREYYPLGSDVAKRSDARIVCATNQVLKDLIQEGRFRKDLYFRLQTHQVRLPPLRDRVQDFPILVDHFLRKAANALGKPVPRLPPQLFTLLRNYSFPGNVRELESMVYDALSKNTSHTLSLGVFRDRILQEGSQEALMDAGQEANPREFSFPDRLPTLKEMDELLVNEALSRAGNNQSIAAGMLGISQQALSKRLKKAKS